MSVVQVMGRSGESTLGQRNPFWGFNTPEEVKQMVRCLKKTEHGNFRKVLKMVVRYIEEGTAVEEDFASLESDGFSEESARIVFSGALTLLRSALRQPSLKAEFFKEDLHSIRLSQEVVTDLHAAIYGSKRPSLLNSSVNTKPRLPQLDNFRWRVDVTISNSSLNRVLEPFLVFELSLSNGTVQTFEVPVAKFQELRYNVATVLKEMLDLEKRNILKLD